MPENHDAHLAGDEAQAASVVQAVTPAPLAGLADWLRYLAHIDPCRTAPNDPHVAAHIKSLNAWADEVTSLAADNARLRKALEGVIASWDARNHERERFTPAHDDPDVGHIPDYWTPAASMVDSEAIAAARAALEGKQP